MKQKRDYKKEVKVGMVITLGLFIIIATMFSVGGKDNFFGKKLQYTILFDATNGLYKGDPVLLTGVEVGNVIDIQFSDELDTKKIVVTIEVARNVAKRIRRDTRASIASASLVYGKVVQLSMGSSDNPPVPPGGEIQTGDAPGFNTLLNSTSDTMDDLRTVINKISSGDGALGAVLNDELEIRRIMSNLNRASQSLAKLMEYAEQGKGAVGMLMTDTLALSKSVKDLSAASEQIRQAAEKLNSRETVYGRLFNDESYGKRVTENLDKALASLARITAKIDTGQGSASLFINDPGLYRGVEDVVFGVRKSSVATWLIRNRRKAGEKTRDDQP